MSVMAIRVNSLKRIAKSLLLVIAVLTTLINLNSHAFAATVPAPSSIRVDNVKVLIQAFSLTGQPLAIPTGNNWWTRYGVSNVVYSFAFGQPQNVWLIIRFQKSPKHDTATFFVSGPNKSSLHLILHHHATTVTNAQPTFVLQTLSGGWIEHGKTNYNLKETYWPDHDLDIPTRDKGPASVATIGGAHGIPQWETSHALGKRYQTKAVHNFGFNVFGATARMANSPAFNVSPGLIPLFPYFSIGYLPGDGVANANWFTINPSPLFFNVLGFQLEDFSFVGFEFAGIYEINSYSSAPNVDFEAPFAFYGFEPGRLQDLVVREEDFPRGDTGGSPPPNIQRSLFRYSWKTNKSQFWEYSLQLAGFYKDKHLIHVGPSKFYGISAKALPSTVMNQPWPWVTFVQLGQGYPGSEGNYFYGGAGSPSIWNWVGGLSSTPTPYLAHPFLMNAADLTDNSHRGLPVGFRGEYSDDYFHKPQLYISPIDDVVHLLDAQGGIENLGHRLVLRTKSLDNSAYQNVWMLQQVRGKLLSYDWTTRTIDTLYDFSPVLLSVSPSSITIKHTTEALKNTMIRPPKGKGSLATFKKVVGPYQNGRNPRELSRWISSFSGPSVTFPHAHLDKLQVSPSTLKMWITLKTPITATAVVGSDGRNLKPGLYLFQYQRNSGSWTVHSATPSHLTIAAIHWPTLHLATPTVSNITLKNTGSEVWIGTVHIKEGKKDAGSKAITLPGHSVVTVPIYWVPKVLGKNLLAIRGGQKTLIKANVMVSAAPRPAMWIFADNSEIRRIATLVVAALLLILGFNTWRKLA